MAERWYTSKDLAERWQVSRQTVLQYRASGRLRGRQLVRGGTYLFHPDDVAAFEGGGHPVESEAAS